MTHPSAHHDPPGAPSTPDPEGRGSLRNKLAQVKLFLCDVDGVLTDGRVIIGTGGEQKSFHIQDGLGMRLLQREGIPVGWVSNRASPATETRAKELKVDYLRQETGDKVAVVTALLEEIGIGWPEVCYVGDDIVDIGVMKRAGVAVAVANGVAEARQAADYVTSVSGGKGAVREVMELILKAQDKWDPLIRQFAK